MNTLGTKPTIRVSIEESYAIAKSFTAASKLTKGQLVKLKTDGTVDKLSGLTDVPFGMVTVGAESGQKATIQTNFQAIVNAKAEGSVTTSNELAVNTHNATTGCDEYKVAVSTNAISAIALSDATDSNDLVVGILRTPRIKA